MDFLRGSLQINMRWLMTMAQLSFFWFLVSVFLSLILIRLVYFLWAYRFQDLYCGKISHIMAAFSTQHFFSNAVFIANVNNQICKSCQLNNIPCNTKTSSGSLYFLGICEWVDYEEIECVCGQNLAFVLIAKPTG